MMQHSAINRGRMMDWIEDALEKGAPLPSDAEIADQFGFEAEESARTLLADLADRGLITIVGTGPLREIRLGRSKYLAPAAQPKRSIVKATRRGDPMDRILAIVSAQATKFTGPSALRGGEDMAAERAGAAPSLVAKAASAPAAGPIARGGEASAEAAACPPPAGATAGRGAGEPKPKWRTVGCKVEEEPYARLVEAARADGVSVFALGGELLQRALAEPVAEPDPVVRLERKPLIRAAMVAAAQRDGFALDAFVRILLERGFASYEADAAAERAA
jgi:hypothetical protein